MQDTYTLRETANITGWSYWYLLEHIKAGNIQAQKRGNKFILTRETVQALMKPNKKQVSTPETPVPTKTTPAIQLPPGELERLHAQGYALKATSNDTEGSVLFTYAPQDETQVFQDLLRGTPSLAVLFLIACLIWFIYTHRAQLKSIWNGLMKILQWDNSSSTFENIQSNVLTMPTRRIADVQKFLAQPETLQAILKAA